MPLAEPEFREIVNMAEVELIERGGSMTIDADRR